MGQKISMVHSIWIKLVSYSAFFFLVLLVAGLFFTNYSASLVLLLGIFLSRSVKMLFHRAASWVKKWKGWKWIIFIFLVIILLIYAVPIDTTQDPPVVEKYSVIIEPVDPKMERFKVIETVFFYSTQEVDIENGQMNSSSLPEREVTSINRGLLLREVHIAPLEANSRGYVNLTLPDGILLRGYLCADYCSKSRIELREFQENSFYDAKDVEGNISYDSYIDKEKISWSASNLNQGIRFAYIPLPYCYLLPVLKPFVEISSLSQLVILFLGIIGSLIVTPIVKPVLSNLVINKIKSWFDRPTKKKPGKKVTLIVSSKGEEKEIEINEDKSS